MRLFLVLGFLTILSGCTHSLHVAHVSDFSPSFKSLNEGQRITANSEQFVIMGFVTETNYVNEAYDRLLAQCPQGRIQAISTQYSTSHGFLSWTNRIALDGLCVN